MKLTFRHVRIFILSCILVYVAYDHYADVKHTTAWTQPLDVVIYPINGDVSAASDAAIARLNHEDFTEINHFLIKQAEHYRLGIQQPFRFHIANALPEKTPSIPESHSIPAAILWSLHMRWWAWKNTVLHDSGLAASLEPDIRLFVEYYQESSQNSYHSIGLQKGQLAIIKNYAEPELAGRNKVIFTHELLHTLGAMDKYDMGTLQPFFPFGYAEPYEQPLYPQEKAELMGGRIPVNETTAFVPETLALCVIGQETAKEIGWIKAANKQHLHAFQSLNPQ